jgi:hypothetical protein
MVADGRTPNQAIRQCQSVLRYHATTFKDVEAGYNQWVPNPKSAAFREAADMLEPLIIAEEN